MLAIAGGKGGCGKTTTTLGLATAFARRGQTPLVVDADSDMPDIHHLSAVSREPGIDQLATDGTLGSIQNSSRFPGVSILPAGSRENLDAALQTVGRWNGPVLVDCPAGASPGAIRPLRHADRTLLVSTEQPQCLEDTRRTAATARQVGAPPVGTLLRETAAVRGPTDEHGLHLLARVPSVDASPFEHPAVVQGWDQIAQTIGDSATTTVRL